jgi:general stress protein YciG
MEEQTPPKRGRGFASMTQEERREISSRGGKAAWACGRAHRWSTFEEAQAAGRKGGRASWRGSARSKIPTEA